MVLQTATSDDVLHIYRYKKGQDDKWGWQGKSTEIIRSIDRKWIDTFPSYEKELEGAFSHQHWFFSKTQVLSSDYYSIGATIINLNSKDLRVKDCRVGWHIVLIKVTHNGQNDFNNIIKAITLLKTEWESRMLHYKNYTDISVRENVKKEALIALLCESITNPFSHKGYFNVNIPMPQDFNTAKMSLIESLIDNVIFPGKRLDKRSLYYFTSITDALHQKGKVGFLSKNSELAIATIPCAFALAITSRSITKNLISINITNQHLADYDDESNPFDILFNFEKGYKLENYTNVVSLDAEYDIWEISSDNKLDAPNGMLPETQKMFLDIVKYHRPSGVDRKGLVDYLMGLSFQDKGDKRKSQPIGTVESTTHMAKENNGLLHLIHETKNSVAFICDYYGIER